MNISAIVMASGLSKRMNKNKLQMKINDKKIYEFVLQTIKNCSCFKEVTVVAKDDEILENASDLEFMAVKNEESHLGQSQSIKLGLRNLKETDGYMFFVADQPFIKVSTIETLVEAFKYNPDKIIIPCYNGKRGNPVIFPFKLKYALLRLEGDQGGRAVLNQNYDKIIEVNINNDYENIDIDTIEDYEKVIKMKVI